MTMTNKKLDYHNLNPKYRSKPKLNKERVFWPSWWAMRKAKMFGRKIEIKDHGYTLYGWEYESVEYINKICKREN